MNVMKFNRTSIIIILILVFSIFVIFLLLDNKRSGPGAYQAELAMCQERTYFDTMQTQDFMLEDQTEWHQAMGDEVRVGGIFSRLNDAGTRIGYEYSCLIKGSQIISAEIK